MDNDSHLVKNLKSNDEAKVHHAFRCVYHKYYRLVCFCISQYVRSFDDQEEIADDTFIDLFQNIHRLDCNKNLKYYLLTIAKNNAISFLRKKHQYELIPDELLKNIPYEDTFYSNDIINHLKKVLVKEELIILIDHLVYGYSFKEISENQQVSINTIMSKYRRALKKANEYLKEVL